MELVAGFAARAVGAFAIAAVASAILVAAVRRWAQRNEILDIPNERSSHSTATPRGGGLAIVVVTLPVLLINFGGWTLAQRATLATAAAVIAIISWIDDLRGVPTAIRFGVHIAAAVAIVIAFGGLSDVQLPFAGHVRLATTGIVLTIIWIAGLTNAYNFMDGIDGIAGAQAVVAGIGWAMLTASTFPAIGMIGAVIAGACAGFLVHNWQPARIFMGDVGSAFVGFLLASLTVAAAQRDRHLLLCGVLLVWPFVFDTAFTFLRRLRRREAVFSAHRSHLYQRLVQTGLSHSQVSLLYAALAAAGVVLALGVQRQWPAADALAVAGVVVMASALWISVVVRETGRRTSPAR